MARKIVWTRSVYRDLGREIAYLEEVSPERAARLTKAVFEAARTLQRFPNRGRKVPELEDSGPRELLIGSTHRLIYRVAEDSIRILRLLAAVQDFSEAWEAEPERPDDPGM